jgi:hypothetical protein
LSRSTAVRAAWAAGGIWSHSARGIGGANVIYLCYASREVYASSSHERIRGRK